MYIGYHSPTHLHSFLSGFSFGKEFKLDENEQPNFDEFHDWVAKKLNYNESTSGWAYMIEDQTEDKEEALWLFFELLDEFRDITHKSLKSVEYSAHYELDISWRGYSRQKKIRGSIETAPKPRPAKLLIRKMDINEGWYSLVALNKHGEVLDIKNSDILDVIFKWGKDIYGVNEKEWE